jgi:hypothetical protein
VRYYKIVLTNQAGAAFTFGSLKGQTLSSLNPDGSFNPTALNIELDIPVAPMHTPAGQAYLKIWGLGLQDLGAATNLGAVVKPNGDVTGNGLNIAVYAGMSGGAGSNFQLANPAQQGLLVQGQIFQAFGNWVSTDMSIDLILAPSTGTIDQPLNFTLNWTAGTTLASALQTTLSAALPKAKLQIQLSPRLVQNNNEVGVYGTLTQLATFCQARSQKIITDANYPGVSIAYDGAIVKVFDRSTQPPPTDILFTDLIGQPTWIAPGVIQAKLVLRGDLDVTGYVTLPQSLVTNTAAAMTSLTGNNPANQLTFKGPYFIREMHHYGNFRQPDAGSWATVINLTPQSPAVSS